MDLNVVLDISGIKKRLNVFVCMNVKVCKREYCVIN